MVQENAHLPRSFYFLDPGKLGTTISLTSLLSGPVTHVVLTLMGNLRKFYVVVRCQALVLALLSPIPTLEQ